MASVDSKATEVDDTRSDPILETFPLGFQWATVDPFIVAVHHVDHYPAGNQEMGPVTLEGQREGGADPSTSGWSMYYGSDVPGFPQHPHRGFETVTVVRQGMIDHADSLGATARYGGGDVQWLTAGGGIEHAEMFPLLDETGPNTSEIFQIWLNLPARDKMVAPYFTMFWREELPRKVLKDDEGHVTQVLVVAGSFEDLQPLPPPPHSWASKAEAELAIWLFEAEPSAEWILPPTTYAETVRTLYVFEGSVAIGDQTLHAPVGIVLRPDVPVALGAGIGGAAAIVLQARPIGEPVAMGGPFVMNDRSEIEQAYRDYRHTGFGGWPWSDAHPVHPRSAPRFARHPDGRSDLPENGGG
jgi:quercetin 2,3-dioxygenase